MHNKALHMTAFILVVIGALNWGLVGLLNLNLVELILGFMPLLERLVYILVGLSAAYLFFTHKKDCKTCSAGGASMNHSSAPSAPTPPQTP